MLDKHVLAWKVLISIVIEISQNFVLGFDENF